MLSLVCALLIIALILAITGDISITGLIVKAFPYLISAAVVLPINGDIGG